MKTNPTYMNKKVRKCGNCIAFSPRLEPLDHGCFKNGWFCSLGYTLSEGQDKSAYSPSSGECPKPLTIKAFNTIKSIQEKTVGKR